MTFTDLNMKVPGTANKLKATDSEHTRILQAAKMNGLKQRIIRQGIAVEAVSQDHYDSMSSYMQANRREIALCIARLKRMHLNVMDYDGNGKAKEIFDTMVENFKNSINGADMLIEEAERPRKTLLAAIGAIVTQMMDEHRPPKIIDKLEKKGKLLSQ